MPSEKDTVVETLVPVLEQDGSVRVIVGLHTQMHLEGSLEAYEIEGQRAMIAEAQRTASERLAHTSAPVKVFQSMPYMVLRVDDAAALELIAADPDVASIEPDQLVAPTLDTSTTLTGARAAWAQGYGGDGWAVAILDTGVMKTHSHLAGKVISEACYSTTDAGQGATTLCPGGSQSTTATGSGVNCSAAGCDHGTHVAAIAASGHTQYGGVAHNANLVAMQVFSQFNSTAKCGSSGGPCVLAYSSDWLEGMERVLALSQSGMKIAAVNLSLGGGQQTSTCDSAFPSGKAAIDQLASQGIATVIAAGNDSYTNAVGFPGCISTAVTVGATTKQDAVASYSNMAAMVDLVAPGSTIYAAVTSSTTAVGGKSGTSMAAPHVAGAFAVMKSAKANMSVAQGLAALQSTGVAITDQRSGGTHTKPRISIAAAIASMTGPSACTRAAPTISVAQPKPVLVAGPVTFVATITNNDEGACSAQAFDVSTDVPTNWTASASKSGQIAPGAMGTAEIVVTAPEGTVTPYTEIQFTAASAQLSAFSARTVGVYQIACGREAPDLAAEATAARQITVQVGNNDADTCGTQSKFRMVITSDIAMTPGDGDIVVDNAGERTAQLAISDGATAGKHEVKIALYDATGEEAASTTLMVTINSAGDAGYTGNGSSTGANLGCSTSRGGSGFSLVVGIALALTLRRRRRF